MCLWLLRCCKFNLSASVEVSAEVLSGEQERKQQKPRCRLVDTHCERQLFKYELIKSQMKWTSAHSRLFQLCVFCLHLWAKRSSEEHALCGSWPDEFLLMSLLQRVIISDTRWVSESWRPGRADAAARTAAGNKRSCRFNRRFRLWRNDQWWERERGRESGRERGGRGEDVRMSNNRMSTRRRHLFLQLSFLPQNICPFKTRHLVFGYIPISPISSSCSSCLHPGSWEPSVVVSTGCSSWTEIPAYVFSTWFFFWLFLVDHRE